MPADNYDRSDYDTTFDDYFHRFDHNGTYHYRGSYDYAGSDDYSRADYHCSTDHYDGGTDNYDRSDYDNCPSYDYDYRNAGMCRGSSRCRFQPCHSR